MNTTVDRYVVNRSIKDLEPFDAYVNEVDLIFEILDQEQLTEYYNKLEAAKLLGTT